MEVNNPQEEKDNSKPLIKHQGAFLFPAPLSYQVFLESPAGEPPHLPSPRDWESQEVVEGEVKTLRCPVDVNTRLYR